MMRKKRAHWLSLGFGLVLVWSMPAAWSQVQTITTGISSSTLSENVQDLLKAIIDIQNTANDGIPDEYDQQLDALYGNLNLDNYVGELQLPDTFTVGEQVSTQTGNNPYNLGPYAPRTLMNYLLDHEANRVLTHSAQIRRVSQTSQQDIKTKTDELHTKLQQIADQAVSYAEVGLQATSTQDAIKAMNQQMALINASTVATSLEALKSQDDLIGNLGNLQMLVSDVGEALDIHQREQYYQSSQQILSTTAGAFAAAETLAWQSLTP